MAVVIGVAVVCYTVYKVLDKPDWLTLSLAIVATVAGSSVPALVVRRLYLRYNAADPVLKQVNAAAAAASKAVEKP